MKRIRSHRRKQKRIRTYGSSDDGLFLERIMNGTLRVNTEKATVETCLICKGKWKEMKQEMSSDGYYLIRCYLNGKRRRTRLHRLIWMASTGLAIPEGFDIHHKDHNRKNNGISNLEMVESHSHRIGHFPWYISEEEPNESEITEDDVINDWGVVGVPF